MLVLSSWMSSYRERPIFMYVLGTVHRAASANRVVREMRPLSQLGSKGPGCCTFSVLLQRPGWKPPIAAASSPSFREINGDDHKVQSLLDDSVVIDAAPIGRASADCRAAHSITGLTGCNPTCISAPAASLGQWLDAHERSSVTGSTLLVGLASDRLPALPSHPSAQSNPNRR